MSKRKKTGFPNDLWVVQYVDRMNWSDSYDSEPMPRAEAERKLAELTDNRTKHTERGQNTFYYTLKQHS